MLWSVLFSVVNLIVLLVAMYLMFFSPGFSADRFMRDYWWFCVPAGLIVIVTLIFTGSEK